MTGTPILQGAADLLVEVAWGADLAADPTGWVWTDITGDVLQANGGKISMRHGRGDEASASQPASCTLTLDNRGGGYSLGPQSANYPNVRRDTPVRVSADGTTLFYGFAVGFTPQWDVTGVDATVQLVAAGTLRRLGQGSSPVMSSLRRGILGNVATSGVVGYWPCEEGVDAVEIASGIGGPAMQIMYKVPKFAANAAFACSAPLPVLDGARYDGPVPAYTDTGETQLRFLVDVPSGGGTDNATLVALSGAGTAAFWQLRYRVTGDIEIVAYDNNWAFIFSSNIGFDLDGRRGQFGLQLTQVGADIEWNMDFLELGAASSSGFGSTLAGYTFRNANLVGVNTDSPSGKNANIAIGHVTLGTEITSETQNIVELNAYLGERTTGDDRIARLSDENDVPINLIGDFSGTLIAQPADQMGPQRVGTYLQLLRECEVADQGILYDGVDAGLTYVTRRVRLNSDALLTLDASTGEVAHPFEPVDDDQRTRNLMEVTRKGGGTARAEDVDGPLGTAAIGVYDDSVTVNTHLDANAAHYAGWLLHAGTSGGAGYRYPRLRLDLHKHPGLIADWLAMTPGRRIDVTNLDDVRTQQPAQTVSLCLEGYQQTIDQFRWTVDMVCSPYEPWRVIELTDAVGDTTEFAARLAPTTATLNAGVAAGATSLSVATTGPLWTTDSDDMPLVVEILGVPVTVTAIAGASSPQTFTVTGATVTKALASGSAVTIHRPTVLSL